MQISSKISIVLIRTISQYLESHKRLVVPQLGTFIVKEPGVSIVFSELLKRDDGTLRRLLLDEGLGELEAAGEIDRFVFEVRHAVEHGLEFRLDGFGVMKPGPNGTIAFAFEPRLAESASGTSAAAVAPDGKPKPVRQPYDEPRVSTSVKMAPDPSVRGLRYGKPPKTTNAYTYVDRPPRRRKADRFIWIALIAAAVAVAAIAFGYLREAKDRETEMQYLEQPADTHTAVSGDAAQPEQPITE
ncbi:MAG: hypothetical protein LUC96_09120 [Alistipes sp.]|uniref:hypothetical protein n=1 Tax=Alistipes sp. TaxID=1872444 RepID=UPI0025C58675|nr:hypothetical protein [Alistipes sp.]MCD8275128.1 hypothetical protein [Alistipes sp.]